MKVRPSMEGSLSLMGGSWHVSFCVFLGVDAFTMM